MTNTQVAEVKLTPVQQMDVKLTTYADMLAEKKRLDHNMKLLKASIGELVREHDLSGHQIPIAGSDRDIKVSVSQKQTRTLDVHELATDLGVSETDAKKKEVLMRAIAEGKLTMADYEGYFYYENVEKLSIRTVKGGN